MFRIRNAMGREKWQEQSIDEIMTRRESFGTALEDDLDEIRRRR